jgi:diguanylate cyclase (GGDEF)-like protein/PAS domain S-box-containing protein
MIDTSRERAEWYALLAALMLVSLAFLIPAWTERTAAIEREQDRLAAATLVVEESVSRSLAATDRAILRVRDEVRMQFKQQDDWTRVADQLKTLSDAMPGVRSMLIVDATGHVLAFGSIDSVHIPAGTRTVADKSYFQTVARHPEKDTLYVSAPFVTAAGVWTFNLARAIISLDGTFEGLVVATIDPEDYRLLLVSARYVQDQFSALEHGQGKLFLIEPADRGELGSSLAMPGTFFTRHMQSGLRANSFRGMTPAATGERLASLRTIAPSELHMDQPLVIVVGRNVDALLASWTSMMEGRVAMLLLLWTGSVSALWLWQRSNRRSRAESLEKIRQIDHLFASEMSLLAINDSEGRCLRVSQGWAKTLGWDIQALRGQKVEPLMHPDDMETLERARRTLASTGQLTRYACRLRDTDGHYHEMEFNAEQLDGLRYIEARDVTQERRIQRELQALTHQLLDKEAELTQLAQHDGMTNLVNRRHFDEELAREWRRCLREQQPLSLVMIDIDHFKLYNDHYGHPQGDRCLKAVTAAMRDCVQRPLDVLARYGGEEFAALLVNTPLDGALKVAEEFRQAVTALQLPHEKSTTAACVTLSIGIKTLVPTESDSISSLLREADAALYQAKARGRNQVCIG